MVSPLGTPGSVLGIHLKNAYAKKPRNREERIEMKHTNFKKNDGQSHITPSSPKPHQHNKSQQHQKSPISRNKQLAPNGIKKNATASHAKRTSPRRAKASLNQINYSKKMSPQKKAIRGLQLYQFTESARTLRSATLNGADGPSPPRPS